jgi:hypothetical protein
MDTDEHGFSSMTITFAILFVAALAFAIILFVKNKPLTDEVWRMQNWAHSLISREY